MNKIKDSFCSFCGTAYSAPLAYPRKCANLDCAIMVWDNPIPVSVVLLPVRDGAREGLLVVRRGIEPQKGKLALVGGFLEAHESWQMGGAREVLEETGIRIDPGTLTDFWFASSEPRPNRLLLFSTARPIDRGAVDAFTPNTETLERGLVFGPRGLETVFAFSLHVEAARRYFARTGVDSEHAYCTL